MIVKLLSKAGAGAAFVAGALMLGQPTAAQAHATLDIWIGIPGLEFWRGPGYYKGNYRNRLSCNEGRRIVDRRRFNSVRAIDCTPRYYHYRAKRGGNWYTVRFDARTARMTYWRR